MNRNLKALGLALLAAFALSAVAASSASAKYKLTTGTDATTLTSSEATEQKFEINSEEYVVCHQVTFDTTVGTETTTELTAENFVFENDCTLTRGATTVVFTIDFNGCDFLFTVEEETEVGHKWSGPAHIKCPAGKHIEVTATGLHLQCLDIPEQTPTTPTVDYTNEGTGTTMDVRIKSTVEGITYEKTGSCGSGEANNAKYIGEVTVTGENAAKEHVSVTIS